MTTVENRDLVHFTEYQQDRIDALRRKIAELEAAIKVADEQIAIRDEIIASQRGEK